MYVVLGASGNTGSIVANALLDLGKEVRVVGRDSKNLAPFVNRGAEAFTADVVDGEALGRAFAGAEAVYSLTPPNLASTNYRAYQDQVTDAVAKAIETAGVKYAVTLSSVGADKAEKTGPVAGLHAMESRFAQIPGLNALHLRAGYFMENTLPQIGIIQQFGMMAGPVRADLPLPMIATRDIGAAAVDALLRLDFSGQQTRELLGQRDLTYSEVARIVGAAIGKPAITRRAGDPGDGSDGNLQECGQLALRNVRCAGQRIHEGAGTQIIGEHDADLIRDVCGTSVPPCVSRKGCQRVVKQVLGCQLAAIIFG